MNQKAVIYTRVSTEDQKENGFSLQDQEARLRKFCRKEQIEIVAHYQDDHSAKDFNRPKFQQMLTDLKDEKIAPNWFICVRMDRFSRDTHLALNMIQTLKRLGVELRLVEGNYDLSVPENWIPFIINIALPQVENERRGLNTKRGMRQAKREGRWMGTAPKGYKYKRENGNSFLVPGEYAKHIREAFKEFSKGIYSMEEVRHNLLKKGFLCSKNQFTLLLRNPVYLGKIKIEAWKDEPVEIANGLHDALVSEETFNQVQLILEGRKKKSIIRTTRNESLPLRGFFECPICKGNLTGSGSRSRTGAKHFYYHCQKGCKLRFRADEANGEFVNYLQSFKIPEEILNLYYHIMQDVFKDDDAKRDNEINTIDSQVDKLRDLINKVEDSFFEGVIDAETYHKAKARYKNEIDGLLSRKAELEAKDSNFMQYVNYGFALLKNLDRYYSKSNIAVKQKIISSIFPEKLIYQDKKYRTTKINEALSLLTNNINGLGLSINKKAIISDGQSYKAPRVGLGTTSQKVERPVGITEFRIIM